MPPRRPTAFEVSFGESQDDGPGFRRNSRQVGSLKRRNESGEISFRSSLSKAEPQQLSQSDKMPLSSAVEFSRGPEPQHHNFPSIPPPRYVDSPEVQQQLRASLAMGSMDPFAKTMASIAEVTKFPDLAQSAELVATIIDIVASMDGNEVRLRGLARTTAMVVSMIYQEEGYLMDFNLQTVLAEVHDQLIEIARFVQEELEGGKHLRSIRKKELKADAINKYQERLDDEVSAFFNFQAKLDPIVSDQIPARLVTHDQSTNDDKGKMPLQSLQTIDDTEELDKKDQQVQALEPRKATFEEHKEHLAHEQTEWYAKREAAELVDQAKEGQEENERRALTIPNAVKEKREHEARIREMKLQEGAEIVERHRRKKEERLKRSREEQPPPSSPQPTDYDDEDEDDDLWYCPPQTAPGRIDHYDYYEDEDLGSDPHSQGPPILPVPVHPVTGTMRSEDAPGAVPPVGRPGSLGTRATDNPTYAHANSGQSMTQMGSFEQSDGSSPDMPRMHDGSRDPSITVQSSETLYAFDGTSLLQGDEIKAEEKTKPVNIVSAIKSEIICAEEVAGFLHTERDSICNALNQRLSVLGYTGDYILQVGFNESLFHQGIEHPEVFLILNESLEDDDVAISQHLSPIFSPHATVLYMASRVINLIPPNELGPPLSYQESSPSPAPIHQLNSSNQSRSVETSGGSQRFCEQGDEEPTDNPPRDNEDKGKHPDEERDGEKQMDEEKGKTKEDDRVLDEYKRQLQLHLETPLIINRTASKESGCGSYEFNLGTEIHVRLRSNRGGRDWHELTEDASKKPQDPLCSVSLDRITISRDGPTLHSLTALQVHIEGASQTIHTCEELLPEPTRHTEIKFSSETRKKGVGSATLGPKPEAKLELGLEKATRMESTLPTWKVGNHRMKKAGTYATKVDYILNGFGEVSSENFHPGPSAIFSYEGDQTDSSLNISVRALWSERLDTLPKNRFKLFGSSTLNSPNLIYANFYHKFSFAVKLEDLMREGKDDAILRGKNAFVGDSIQDSREARGNMLAAMPIQIRLDGKPVIKVPLRRTVSTAIKRGDWEEGEQQVTSPDPDPFQRTGDAKA